MPKDERCRMCGKIVLRIDQKLAAASIYNAGQVWQTLSQHAARSNNQARNEHRHSACNCNRAKHGNDTCHASAMPCIAACMVGTAVLGLVLRSVMSTLLQLATTTLSPLH